MGGPGSGRRPGAGKKGTSQNIFGNAKSRTKTKIEGPNTFIRGSVRAGKGNKLLGVNGAKGSMIGQKSRIKSVIKSEARNKRRIK